MKIDKFVKENEIMIFPGDEHLVYTGRIGQDEDGDPVLVFPGSGVSFGFYGKGVSVVISAEHFYWDMFVGCMVDGREMAYRIPEDGTLRLDLAEELPECDHVITFFKRQDACNVVTLRGVILANGSRLLPAPQRPARRIEIYGDSVSAGEVSEAVAYAGKSDPEGHGGFYSNSMHSYSQYTADILGAELHNISQGGIALMKGTGWFAGPDFIGMEQIYDKVRYYPETCGQVSWDFAKYTPHVVVVAIGQNDANPVNFMSEDYSSERSLTWRRHYADFIRTLRRHYPKALIICTTTILNHDPAWDRAIYEAVGMVEDDCVKHFIYSRNGSGTPGHIRIPEAKQMARELSEYILSFGEQIWED